MNRDKFSSPVEDIFFSLCLKFTFHSIIEVLQKQILLVTLAKAIVCKGEKNTEEKTDKVNKQRGPFSNTDPTINYILMKYYVAKSQIKFLVFNPLPHNAAS